MPTPPVNRNLVLTRPGYRTDVGWNNVHGDFPPTRINQGNVDYEWSKEVRPASGSSPIQGKLGWRPCRGWSHTGWDWNYPSNVVHSDINWGTYGTRRTYEDGSFWGLGHQMSPPAVPAFPAGLINRAEVQALNRLKQQDINLGTFLAEFRLTADMVAHSATSIARSVRGWRGGNSPKAWDAVKRYERGNGRYNKWRQKIPQSWLELQYGWKPLLSDILGAIQHLGRPGREPLAHVKGHASSVEYLDRTYSPDGNNKATLEFQVKHEVWVALYYYLKDARLAEQSSLGLLNPVEIVWECLPYSFVVDWFLPIGPWMSSLTATAGFTFKGGSRSIKTTVTGGSLKDLKFKPKGTSYPIVTTYGDGPSLTGEGAANFLRTCYDASPVPGLYVKSPLSGLHVANAIALLAQAFR